jgi:hypothetical protein
MILVNIRRPFALFLLHVVLFEAYTIGKQRFLLQVYDLLWEEVSKSLPCTHSLFCCQVVLKQNLPFLVRNPAMLRMLLKFTDVICSQNWIIIFILMWALSASWTFSKAISIEFIIWNFQDLVLYDISVEDILIEVFVAVVIKAHCTLRKRIQVVDASLSAD